MEINELAAPVLKWAGGKRQILQKIMKFVPEKFNIYHEPFLGGGAVLLELQPKKARVNDLNRELMNVYSVIKNDVDALIENLSLHHKAYSQSESPKEYFYKIRRLDREPEVYANLTPAERAARTIFLNKTCFNGLYRVNRLGQFNTPFGYYKNPNIVNEATLRAVSDYFTTADVKIFCQDFEETLGYASKGDCVYLDPPYDPVSDTANFTAYDKSGFGEGEQIRLSQMCHRLHARGAKFLLSNSATDFVISLYKGYQIEIIQARRAVSARVDGRGHVQEVLVRNFDP